MSSHLTYEDRLIIEAGITNGDSKSKIAKKINKNKTTVDREIKNHRFVKNRCKMGCECTNYRFCAHGRYCPKDCEDFIQFECKRRDVSPGACIGCPLYNKCRMSKIRYDAKKAQQEYEAILVESREGSNTTTSRLIFIGDIIKPLLEQGQSLQQIKYNHPEISESLSTLYAYIDIGLFQHLNIQICNISLRRKMTRKESKNRSKALKMRKNRVYLRAHTYSDYIQLIADNPDLNVVQMDTVYNNQSGPYIQTFKFMKYGYFFAILHEEKTQESMNEGILILESILGRELFKEDVQVILTDRGTEFSAMNNLELLPDGTRRFNVFYCDAMASNQKGSLENKHIELRYIVPSGYSFESLGLTNQGKLNLVISHINSCPRKKLAGKTASEILEFLNPSMFKKFLEFGISVIEKDKVTLNPSLIK